MGRGGHPALMGSNLFQGRRYMITGELSWHYEVGIMRKRAPVKKYTVMVMGGVYNVHLGAKEPLLSGIELGAAKPG